MTKVLIPFENKKDIEEIPKKVLKKVELILVKHMDDVLREALVLKEGETLFAPDDECEPFCLADVAQTDDKSESAVTAH